MKNRDLANLLNRAAAALETYADGRTLTGNKCQDLIEDLLVAAKELDPPGALSSEFLDEVIAVCRKYNIVLGHEDEHGAFELWDVQDCNRDECEQWLRDAYKGGKPSSPSLKAMV